MTLRRYLVGLSMLVSLLTLSPAIAGPLHDAAKSGDLDQVRQMTAAPQGFFAKLKQIIGSDGDVNATDQEGATPLHKAALGGHKDVVELLLTRDAEIHAVDDFGATPSTMQH